MLALLGRLFGSSEFMPHGHCFYWRPGLVWLHVTSDALIGTAYVVISLTLWGLVRRIRLPFSPMFLAFGLFIGACGVTHYLEVWTLWVPDYWLSGVVKAVTAIASVATGVYLVQLRPVVLEVTRAAQLSEERRVQLEAKNRELETLYARVKELDAARTRFFANVSHELRTPLALVLGPLEKLLGAELPPAWRRDLEVARRNGRVLLRHVDDLLDVARLEEGRMPLRWAQADLAALVRDTAAQFEALARERRVALRVEAPDRLPAELDRAHVERVLANLLGNAFAFAPEGGRVECRVEAAGARARVVVDDDGPGIPEALRRAVFERFQQGPARSGGAGLGLAIARELVELHGGAIWAEAAPGGGARLAFELPLAAPPGTAVGSAAPPAAPTAPAAVERAREAARVAPPDPAGEAAATVLVAEDHPDMRRFIVDALQGAWRVVTASDGAEALEVAHALRPDLVVTDVMMPRLGGEELLEALRQSPALATTPVIVLTARADVALREALLRGGAVDYLVKPFQPAELRARVRNALALKRSRDTLSAALSGREGDVEALARELALRERELTLALETAQVSQEQAERASAVKSTFLGMLSHELRTPITAMQLSLAVLKADRDGALGERQRTHLERVERASQRLLGLIEALLEYTRVESGKLVVKPEEVDLAALAAEVVDETLPQAQRKLLALELAPAAPMPPARTDPRLVRLVLVNLVVNAVKYTERGSVRVAVSHGADGHLLEVADTGPGIPAEARLTIFEPFRQLASPGHAQGVGLGLSLVRGVVEALGAELRVESEQGRGTTFRVLLRPAPGPALPSAPPPAA